MDKISKIQKIEQTNDSFKISDENFFDLSKKDEKMSSIFNLENTKQKPVYPYKTKNSNNSFDKFSISNSKLIQTCKSSLKLIGLQNIGNTCYM